MDNASFDIEICKQCQHKDCRYCRFNPKNAEKSTTDRPHDDSLTVESAISILRRKANEFVAKTSCSSCLLKDKCWETNIGCRTMFLDRVVSGFIDADGNLTKKRQPQD